MGFLVFYLNLGVFLFFIFKLDKKIKNLNKLVNKSGRRCCRFARTPRAREVPSPSWGSTAAAGPGPRSGAHARADMIDAAGITCHPYSYGPMTAAAERGAATWRRHVELDAGETDGGRDRVS